MVFNRVVNVIPCKCICRAYIATLSVALVGFALEQISLYRLHYNPFNLQSYTWFYVFHIRGMSRFNYF